jgi:hypothetical protein
MTEAAGSTDHYSNSIFVIEVDWMPTAIFEAKWHRDAELICQSWANRHSEHLLVKGSAGLEFPPVIKLRLAHRDEIAAYTADAADCEVQEGTRIVHLRRFGPPADE